jgi:hypothetical protein
VSAANSVARLRGLAAGLLTAALAVAAHGIGGGVLPSAGATSLLAVLAATVGALAARHPHEADARTMVGFLGAGQLTGHVLLSVVGHAHTASAAPPAVMLTAHLVAIAVGALLIAAGERLCHAVLRVVRAVVRIGYAAFASLSVEVRRVCHPLRSALLLAVSVSHRGPPVSLIA